jgi:hypothetical protein
MSLYVIARLVQIIGLVLWLQPRLPPSRRARARKFAAIWTIVLATILGVSFACVAPAMAQSTFPDFDYQKECEKLGRPHPPSDVTHDTTMLINYCLDGEASARKSAEYKWELASENVRAKAMAHVDDIRRNNGGSSPFYRYLNNSISVFSEQEATEEANKRLHEKRPGVHY